VASPDVNGVLSYNTQRTGRRKHRLASLAQPGTTFRRTDCCIVVSWNCFLGHLLKFAKDRGNDSLCPVRRHQPSPVQEATPQEQRAISSGYLCCAKACLDGCIRRNPVAPASGSLANILLFECDSLWICVTAGRTQSTTRCTAAAHMTLWFAFTMTLAT